MSERVRRATRIGGTAAVVDRAPHVAAPSAERCTSEPQAPAVRRPARRCSSLGAAYVAINLHRRGHTTGDDFALYLRQAKSLFEGNIADVISDNRFLFDHSTAVTPPIYPWGWPLLLSPFVRVWGIDFDRLKLVEVAVFCAWLVLVPRHRPAPGRAHRRPRPDRRVRHVVPSTSSTPTSCSPSTRTCSPWPS